MEGGQTNVVIIALRDCVARSQSPFLTGSCQTPLPDGRGSMRGLKMGSGTGQAPRSVFRRRLRPQLGASPPLSTGLLPNQCKVARNFSIFGKFSRNVRVLKIATSRNFVRNFTSPQGRREVLAFGLNQKWLRVVLQPRPASRVLSTQTGTQYRVRSTGTGYRTMSEQSGVRV